MMSGISAFALWRKASLTRVKILRQHLSAASSSAEDDVTLEIVGSKGLITINRPKVLNTLTIDMIRKIYSTVRSWEEDAKTDVIVIQGAGEKAFCAGADLVALAKSAKSGTSLCKDLFKGEYILNNAIGALKIPWVPLMDGITMGQGVGVSIHGRYRVATERTVFSMPETAIGLLPDVGCGYFLPRLKGKLGLYLGLTGFRLYGRDVQNAGIATHFIDSQLIPSLQKDLFALDQASISDIDRMLNEYQAKSQTQDKEFLLEPYIEKINTLFQHSTMEEICQALKRDGSDWCQKQLETLRQMSPTSLKVTLEQQLRGASLDLQDVFQMEYRITQRIVLEPDFLEGVRARLVDKDNVPKWNPSTLEDVSREKVESYFKPLETSPELKFE